MGKTNENHLKRLNPTGTEWKDMTEEQRLALKKQWDAVVSDPKELYCTCPRTGCRNNHNCLQCVTLHRYYDALPDCLRFVEEKLDEGIPETCILNTHFKMQNDGNEDTGMVDPHNKLESRERLGRSIKEGTLDIYQVMDRWDKIAKNPKNRACRCKNTDCWYHGNCVKCIALHRHYEGVPACVRYIIDDVEAVADRYWETHPEEK